MFPLGLATLTKFCTWRVQVHNKFDLFNVPPTPRNAHDFWPRALGRMVSDSDG